MVPAAQAQEGSVKVLAEVSVPSVLSAVSFAPYDSTGCVVFASGTNFMRLYKYNDVAKAMRVYPEFVNAVASELERE